MLSETEEQALHKAYKLAYTLGLVLCVFWPLVLQLLLGPVIKPGANAPAGVFRQLGYTFTGLAFGSAAFVSWRSGKVRASFHALGAAERPRVLFREVLIYAAIFELSSLWGLLYWMLVGLAANHHARAFLMLSSLMFLFFVPKFGAWKDAAEGLE